MTTTQQPIYPCLWFDNQAEEAMHFYVSVFPNSKAGYVSRYGKNMPAPEGTAMTAEFELNGQKFMGLNGGPLFKFSEAVSFVIPCQDQAEVDHYWNSLTADGGQESQCGWLKDKFGLSWQVVPNALGEMMKGGDAEKSQRMMQALMQMKKLDISALEKAYNGN